MKVKEVMMKMGEFPSIEKETILKEALIEMGKINLGLVCIVDKEKKLLGLMTDGCLLYTSPSPRDRQKSRMPSSA